MNFQRIIVCDICQKISESEGSNEIHMEYAHQITGDQKYENSTAYVKED